MNRNTCPITKDDESGTINQNFLNSNILWHDYSNIVCCVDMAWQTCEPSVDNDMVKPDIKKYKRLTLSRGQAYDCSSD
jgi:hypothetical protein